MSSSKLFVVLTFFLLIIIASHHNFFSSAAFIRLDKSEPICFVEETTYSREQIFLQYTRRDYTRTQDQYIHLEVSDPVDGIKKPFMKRELKSHTGTVAIQTLPTRIGEYTICISNPLLEVMKAIPFAKGKFGSYEDAVEMDVLIDHEGRRLPIESAKEHHASVAQRKTVHIEGRREDDEVFEFTDETGHTVSSLRSHSYLDRVEKTLNNIENQVEQALADSRFFVRKQAEMRSTSESTFSRIWSFSVLVIVTLVLMSIIQVLSLRRFFKQRKIA